MTVSVRTDYSHDINRVTSSTMSVSDFLDVIVDQMRQSFEEATCLMVYNVGGVAYPFANNHQRTNFYNFASPVEGTEFIESIVTIEGETIRGSVFQHVEQENSIVFYADEQVPIGLYLKDNKSFYLYFDAFIQNGDTAYHLATRIARALTVLDERFSWMKNPNNQTLLDTIKKHNQTDHENDIRRVKNDIESIERNIEMYRRELTTALNNRIQREKRLEQLLKSSNDTTSHIIEQLEMLRTVPLVLDVHIKGEYVHIFTDNIYIYEPESEDRFHAGKYEIKIRMSDSDIKFFNYENRRRSYWGRKCHHPHVSESGNPCLGNISTTLAELCSTKDVYSLAIVAINFLEAVNIEDSAGKYIRNWDQVDDDNVIIHKGNPNGNPNEECVHCGESEVISVYTRINSEGDLYGEELICHECAGERDVYYSEFYDEYMLGELSEHPNNQEDENTEREYV